MIDLYIGLQGLFTFTWPSSQVGIINAAMSLSGISLFSARACQRYLFLRNSQIVSARPMNIRDDMTTAYMSKLSAIMTAHP